MKRSKFYLMLLIVSFVPLVVTFTTMEFNSALLWGAVIGWGVYLLGGAMYELLPSVFVKLIPRWNVNFSPPDAFLTSDKEQFLEAISLMSARVYECAVEHGWWEDENPNDAEKIALMHSELSEALEALRKDLMDDKITEFSGVEAELADVVIRVMDFSHHKGLRLGEAIWEKYLYNLTRDYKHGGKKF